MSTEDKIPRYFDVDYESGLPLRLLSNFRAKDTRGRLCSLENISDVNTLQVEGKLVLPSQIDPNTMDGPETLNIKIKRADSWCFDYFPETRGVWIQTMYAWYKLVSPSKNYAPLHSHFQRKVDVWFAVYDALDEEEEEEEEEKDLSDILEKVQNHNNNNNISREEVLEHSDFILQQMANIGIDSQSSLSSALKREYQKYQKNSSKNKTKSKKTKSSSKTPSKPSSSSSSSSKSSKSSSSSKKKKSNSNSNQNKKTSKSSKKKSTKSKNSKSSTSLKKDSGGTVSITGKESLLYSQRSTPNHIDYNDYSNNFETNEENMVHDPQRNGMNGKEGEEEEEERFIIDLDDIDDDSDNNNNNNNNNSNNNKNNNNNNHSSNDKTKTKRKSRRQPKDNKNASTASIEMNDFAFDSEEEEKEKEPPKKSDPDYYQHNIEIDGFEEIPDVGLEDEATGNTVPVESGIPLCVICKRGMLLVACSNFLECRNQYCRDCVETRWEWNTVIKQKDWKCTQCSSKKDSRQAKKRKQNRDGMDSNKRARYSHGSDSESMLSDEY